jgi:branched-chain amino acid transport system ATP-binding protein
MLLDEPSTGMTHPEKEDLARFLLRIRHEQHIPMLWVEHDMELVADLCDQMIVLSAGRKIAEGKSENVLKDKEVVKIFMGGEQVQASAND